MTVALSDIRETVSRTRPAGFTEALIVAAAAHQGQFNKFNDEPYILHVLRVIGYVKTLTLNEDALIVAALHDVVEDTGLTLEHLRGIGFPADTIAGIDAVTRRGVGAEREWYKTFIARAAQHKLGAIVKLADLRDHLDQPEPRFGMHKRYFDAQHFLLRNGVNN